MPVIERGNAKVVKTWMFDNTGGPLPFHLRSRRTRNTICGRMNGQDPRETGSLDFHDRLMLKNVDNDRIIARFYPSRRPSLACIQKLDLRISLQ